MDIKDKIAKLLALADSPNENEARAALLKARALMAQYKLRPEEIKRDGEPKVKEILTGITCTKMTNAWASHLAAIVAEHYCCKSYRSHIKHEKKIEVGFVGLEDDLEVCTRIFKYAYDCVLAHCKEIRAEYRDYYTAAHVRELANAYGFGFAQGLRAAFQAQAAQHQEWGLVMVTPKAVMDVVNQMGRPSTFGSAARGELADKFKKKGYADGQEFDPSKHLRASDTLKALI